MMINSQKENEQKHKLGKPAKFKDESCFKQELAQYKHPYTIGPEIKKVSQNMMIETELKETEME